MRNHGDIKDSHIRSDDGLVNGGVERGNGCLCQARNKLLNPTDALSGHCWVTGTIAIPE